jgi:hypothetical protein
MGEQVRTESFVLLRNDLQLAEKYPRQHRDYNESVGMALLLGLVPLYGICCVVAIILDFVGGPFAWVFLGAVVVVGLFGAQASLGWEARRRALNRDAQGWKRGPWRATINTDGIALETSQAALFYRWSAVQEINATAHQAVLSLGEHDAIVLPRRAFASERDFDSFVLQACRYCQIDERRPPEVVPRTEAIQDHA